MLLCSSAVLRPMLSNEWGDAMRCNQLVLAIVHLISSSQCLKARNHGI